MSEGKKVDTAVSPRLQTVQKQASEASTNQPEYVSLQKKAVALVNRDPAQAAELLADLLERWPGRLGLVRVYARLLMKQSKYEEALPYWQRVSKRAPTDIEAQMALGRIYWKMRRSFDALSCLRTVLKEIPSHRDAHFLQTAIADYEVAKFADRLVDPNAEILNQEMADLEGLLADHPSVETLRMHRTWLMEQPIKGPTFPPNPHEIATDRKMTDWEPHQRLLQIVEQLENIGNTEPQMPKLSEEVLLHEAFGLVYDCPWLAGALAKFHVRRGDIDSALGLYRKLASRPIDCQVWIEAAVLAAKNKAIAFSEFFEMALEVGEKSSVVRRIVDALTGVDDLEAAVQVWKSYPNHRYDLSVRLEIIRVFQERRLIKQLVDEVHSILTEFLPFTRLSDPDRGRLVEIVRRFRNGVTSDRSIPDLSAHVSVLNNANEQDSLVSWILSVLSLIQIDDVSALCHLHCAKSMEGVNTPSSINLEAEVAVLHARYHRFGEAHTAARTLAPKVRDEREYRTWLYKVENVTHFCGQSEDLRYPECVVDVILDECSSMPIGYIPRPGNLLTIIGSLAQGGSERQTVNVLAKMVYDSRVRRAVLAVRTLETEEQRFFLESVRCLPVKCITYGAFWRRKSDILQAVPQLAGRDRLVAAINLLPHNLREEIVRLSELILAERPQAVHLRQDLFAGALACAISGVPKYLIHRGSLSPDLWEHNALQAQIHLRPMRHTYRRLLERANFLIVNNSGIGGATDRNWVAWPDASPFKVVYNAIEFDKLGSDISRNLQLKKELGIPPQCFVIGAAFRVEAVKRPMLWMETASLILRTMPGVHFVIAGDGSMTDAMLSYAKNHGFADRLHMLGRISDVGNFFRMLDVNLLTSEREGLPNVLIEGQHFGVPVVASDVGGANETVEHGITGYLIPANADANIFAEAVLGILRDHDWRARARARAPIFVHSKFNARKSVEELLTYLELT